MFKMEHLRNKMRNAHNLEDTLNRAAVNNRA